MLQYLYIWLKIVIQFSIKLTFDQIWNSTSRNDQALYQIGVSFYPFDYDVLSCY